MATIVNTPGTDTGSSSMGWAVAVIVLIIVIVGGFLAWAHYHSGNAAQPAGTTNVNVTIPAGAGATSGADGNGSVGGTAGGGDVGGSANGSMPAPAPMPE